MLFPKMFACSRICLTGLLLSGAVSLLPNVPAIAQTTVNTNLILETSADESFAVFISRAEINAAVRVQQLFDQDLLRTEVRLTVLGQRGGAIAQVLKLRVSRREWTTYPDPEIWSVYYPESSVLLGFTDGFTPTPKPVPMELPPEQQPIPPETPTVIPTETPTPTIPIEATPAVPTATPTTTPPSTPTPLPTAQPIPLPTP